MVAKGRLRRGLTSETATDVLLTMYGDSTYHLFVVEHGWTHEQVIDHLCDVLPLVLLTPETSARRPDTP